MKKNLISYLIFPKGIQSVLFKSYVYFVPFLYSLTFNLNHLQNLLIFLLIFFLFEFIINPSRYQLNDLADYKDDQQRQYHWQRQVNKDNKQLVFVVVLLRLILGISIAFFLDIRLGYMAIVFLVLQIFYDYFAKRLSPFLAVFTVSIAYPLRSLTVFYGLDIILNQISILLLLLIFFYSTYMVFQWRKNESLFILSNKLILKPHHEFFSNRKVDFFIFISLLLSLLIFISLVTLLAKLDIYKSLTIYFVSLFFIIIFSLFNKNAFKKIINQSHNIFIAFVFIVLTFDRFLIALAISIIIIFLVFWYYRIYAEKFAINYFSENHYDKI